MKEEPEETDITEEEIRKHWLSMITPPKEYDGETTWTEKEPLSKEKEKQILDAIRSSRSGEKREDGKATDAEYLFDLIRKDENEGLSANNEEQIVEFATPESDESEEDKKIISFKKYFLPLGMAAVFALALNPFFRVSQTTQFAGVEFGTWSRTDLMRGGESESNKSALPSWVKHISYSNKADRIEWLDDQNSKKAMIKVWFDEDRGVLMIHRTGMDKSEEIPLNDEQPVFKQISKIINNLKKEITLKE